MADEEAEQESGGLGGDLLELRRLRERLLELETGLRESAEPAVQAATEYCKQLCQTLLEYAEKWKTSEDPLPLLEVYTVAIRSYVKARPYLTSECENVAFVLERLALSCIELLLCLPLDLPENKWEEFQAFVQVAHKNLMENGSGELHILTTLTQEKGVWKNPVLCSILSQEQLDPEKVNEFLVFEGPVLLDMRIKHLMKTKQLTQATALAKLCSDHPEISAQGNFKQTYLVCLCSGSPNEKLMEEIAEVDCKDALEMICNLESDGDEKSALILCAAFLSRQLQQGEMYCAWELTLFWSKLQQRVEPSIQVYLERCRQLSVLTKTVYHIFFLIKVINSEIDGAGLATCIELCVKALRLESSENADVKISICKTISCLLPDDLEVKRACQLSEFLLEPTVDAYYAVEMLYNQPDQKYDEENLPIPNSLRCELLLVLKTQWPFDPEFWDWKTLKRQCLALMGEEASIVSSIDELNDSEVYEKIEDCQEETKETSVNGFAGSFDEATSLLKGIRDEKQKKREIKKLRERGFISARFRNWQAYMQYCVLCDKEFLGHRIVRHAQKHYKDGIYSCPICAQNFNSKENFVPHVTLHVKKSSKERLAAMKPLRRLGRPPKIATTNENQKTNSVSKQEQRPIKKNSLYSTDFIVFNDNDGSDDDNDDKDKPYVPEIVPVQKPLPVNEFTCPVTFCKKGFKYFKNLIAHAKGHKDNEEAKRFLEMQSKKVICQYCRRHFVSVTHLNDHLQMHCGSKPYICIQMKCKAGFNSYAELLTHRKEHQVFRAKCMFPKCGRVFSEAYLLYDHEAQHYNTYTCKFTGCGKVYRSQNELEKHIEEHNKQPENMQQPEGQANQSDLSQPSKANESTDGVAVKEESASAPADNQSSFTEGENYVWNEIKAEPVGSESANTSPNTLQQSDSLPNAAPEEAAAGSVKTEVAIPVSSVKMLAVNQKIRDNFVRRGKLAATTSKVDPTKSGAQQLCSTVDSCLPVFQERKEENCLNQSQNVQNISVSSNTLKPEALESKSLEGQVNIVNTLSMQNQAGYRNSVPISKLEIEDSIKAAANLYNLPLKTLESITFIPSQPSINNSLVPTVSPAAPVQKFSCQVEGCTRTYNSSQSIGKHMKAAHPDQYATFKMQRKNKKPRKSSNLQNVENDEKIVCLMPSQVGNPNGAAFTAQNKTNSNPACSSQAQHLSTTLFPTHLENMTNPVLPVVESVINPSLSTRIKSEPESVLCSQMENLSGVTLPSQLEDLAKRVMPLNIDGSSDPFLPLPAENGPMSLFPSPSENAPSSVFSQLENNTNNFSSQLEGNSSSAFPKEETIDQLFPSRVNNENNFSETSSQLPTPEKMKKDRGRGPNGKERKPKHNKRAKWPAIIRDGKFICSRCFRVFTNPRSLGGHLSKRSYCKPLEGSEISAEALQANGQSLLASMILSSNSLSLQQPQEPTFNPELCFKDPAFLQLLASENRSTALLQTMFPRANVPNFNTSGNEEGNQIIKQALETAGISSTFDTTDVLPHIVTTSCVTGTTQINATVLPNSTMSPLLQTVCNPSTLLTDQNRTLNTKIPSVNECKSLPVFATDDLMLKTIENGLCSSSFSNAAAAAQTFAGNASRVSVISTPNNSVSNNSNKKGTSASKRKRKATTPLVAPNIAQKVAVNNITTGLLAKSSEGNVQTQGDNFQSNLVANCDSQAVAESLTQKLNNADNQLFVASVKENFKTNLETRTLTVKAENGDSQMMATNSCVQANSEEQISEDSVIQNFEKTLEIIKSAMNSQMLEVKTEIQDTGTASEQNLQVNTAQTSSGNSSSSVLLPAHTQFAVHSGNVTAAKSNSTQSETSQKVDNQILEILEGLQKLKLENDSSIQISESVCHCPPADTLAPAVPVVPIENKPLVQVSSETIIHFSDKVNKPFVCQNQGCNYSAMTKDALFKHYGKVHQYTAEMILEIKKHQLKYAPFKCVVASCPKTFTRNSNLRAHCQLVHHFTTEEMVKLKIKRPYGRRSQNEIVNTTSQPVEINLQTLITENKTAAPLDKEGQIKEALEPVNVLEKLLPEKNIPEKLETPPQVVSVPLEQHNADAFGDPEAKVRKVRRHRKEKDERKRRKPVTKPLEFPTRYSPYRPYRCVHQGCFAAFTIQQNLILHYQAVHKSDLPAFSAEVEEESEPSKEERDETETKPTIREFRCEMSDCSRIFQEVPSLIQHYMKLHNMTPEQIRNMKPAPEAGRFSCDQSQCKSSFTVYFNYVTHLETEHGVKIRPNKVEDDGVFKCDCEGCDRIYATRSNLLRHIFNKHNDRHKDHLIRPRRLTPGQENISSKANQEKPVKSKQRGLKNKSGKESSRLSEKTKRKKNVNLENKNAKPMQIQENKAYSLKRGKHVFSIKARNEALSECTSRFVTQYPCMIKGCSSVVTSESNIIRHYKCHKLSKAFTSQHRNLLIVSKQHSVPEVKEIACEQEETDKKIEVEGTEPSSLPSNNDSSTSTLPQKETEKGEKDEVDELTELFITKLINEDCSSAENQAKISSSVNNDSQETNSCPSEKQKSNNLKRANKEKNVSQNKRRRTEKAEEVLPAEVSNLHREEETAVAIQTAEEQPAAFDWSSFKPMGFEVSFLKFLEESAVKQKKSTERDHHSSGTKKGSHSNTRKSNEKTSLATSNNVTWSSSATETFVQFANPSQLQSCDNVKIVLDKTFKDCTERALKQLQEMRPTVSLRRLDEHWENDPEVTAAKERKGNEKGNQN
ncbi:zinc finger protein 292 isoform X1 [Tympanuchus pallidicinctus]|uniref:zinc finger protein 292 isoform X1 n=1 Tax=Tympanuchus pallidicinctus TaxID=109042 RepID=UPI0022875E41|nr:zinc finger protein 292 isoform X1 [Tympanuchus pallidicinctus]